MNVIVEPYSKSILKAFVSVLAGIKSNTFLPFFDCSIDLSIHALRFEYGGFTKFISPHSIFNPSTLENRGHGSNMPFSIA